MSSDGGTIEKSERSGTSVQLSKKIEKFSFDDGLGSDEEIFTKGKLLLDADEGAESEGSNEGEIEETKLKPRIEELPKKNAKIITKVQAAKKILKKKHILPNKKVVFDEEGEVFDEEKAILGKPRADVEEKGGINIELSKQLMKEQDLIDKQIYRDKVKAKHREERLKAKAARRAATLGGEAVLDLGEDRAPSDQEEGSGHGGSDDERRLGDRSQTEENDVADERPHTSKRKFSPSDNSRRSVGHSGDDRSDDDDADNGSDGESMSGDDQNENNGEIPPHRHVPKRLMKIRDKFSLKKRKVSGVEELDTGLNLAGDEELALKLLQS